MNALAVKMVPTAVALAAGIYVVWPYIAPGGGLPAAPAATAETTDLAEPLLRPKLPAPPLRDPFEDPEEKQLLVREKIRKRVSDLVKRVELARKEAAKVAGERGAKGKTQGGPLAGLALNATYNREEKGAAVINGRVFQTGENVRPEDPVEP
jgi:hypothetical protein